jgi:membrane protein implicated in regulation of membrane protease activity
VEPDERRRLLRYALFQVPEAIFVAALLAAAVHWWDWSPGFALLLLAAWLIKDAVLYRFVGIAYAPDSELQRDPLIGARGVVTRPLEPSGWVRVGAERWRAVARDPGARIPAGTAVCVRARRGLTLVVEPGEAPGPEPESPPASARAR